MSLACLLGSGLGEKPRGRSLYDHFPLILEWLDDVHRWTGVIPDQIFSGPEGGDRCDKVVAHVRPAALAVAVHDVLVESGIHPQAVGGMSLGGMAAACIAGALDREALFRLLGHLDQTPEALAGSPPQAAALVYVPRLTEDTSRCYAADREDVYFACDIGPIIDGSAQVIMLTSCREALEKLAAKLSPGGVFMTHHAEAFHSPIPQYVADFTAPHIAKTEFRDSRIPVYSPSAPSVLTTGDEIRDLFMRNSTDPASPLVIHAEMARRGIKLGIVPGASLPPGALKFSFSVARIESPQGMSDAIVTMYGLDIRPSAQGLWRAMVSSPELTVPPEQPIDRWMPIDLDAWTRRVVARHFDKELGNLYWLGWVHDLSFDPREITKYDELVEFGTFPFDELRSRGPAQMVLLSVPWPLVDRAWDSGGATGTPCCAFYTKEMLLHRGVWLRWPYVNEGFEPGNPWLHAEPASPHLIGNGMPELSELYASLAFSIDMDPQRIKRLVCAARLAEADGYPDHLIDQISDVVTCQNVSYINTTPALLRALAGRRPELVAQLRGARLSGTQANGRHLSRAHRSSRRRNLRNQLRQHLWRRGKLACRARRGPDLLRTELSPGHDDRCRRHTRLAHHRRVWRDQPGPPHGSPRGPVHSQHLRARSGGPLRR